MLGFLFALAVLLPVFLLYFLAGLWLERFNAFASVPLYLALYVFGQYAMFRALRYRLANTRAVAGGSGLMDAEEWQALRAICR